MHCDAIPIHETVHHDVSLHIRVPIKSLSVSAVICLLASSLDHAIVLSVVEVVTIHPCVGSERSSRAHNPSLSSAGKLVLLVGATSS
jgi:hypothetical protein